jgi:hypothetical protein
VRASDGHQVVSQDRNPAMRILQKPRRGDLAWLALLLIAGLYLLFSESFWNVLTF